jgi:hypothetical protein
VILFLGRGAGASGIRQGDMIFWRVGLQKNETALWQRRFFYLRSWRPNFGENFPLAFPGVFPIVYLA